MNCPLARIAPTLLRRWTFRLNSRGKEDEMQVALEAGDSMFSLRRQKPAAKEPAIAIPPEQLGTFVGVYSRKAPPLEVTVELLNGKLKYTSFGLPVATLVPIGPTRFRVEGAAPIYVEFEMGDGKVKQVTLERDEQPKVRLLPGR
jgi:hypothetical protein